MKINMGISINNGIQRGAKTHHHDQSITLHNLRVMNIKEINTGTPIPPESLLSFFDIYFLF